MLAGIRVVIDLVYVQQMPKCHSKHLRCLRIIFLNEETFLLQVEREMPSEVLLLKGEKLGCVGHLVKETFHFILCVLYESD